MEKPKGIILPLEKYSVKYPSLICTEDSIDGMTRRYPDIYWVDSDFSSLRLTDGSVDIIELSDFYLELVRKHHIEIILGSTADFNALMFSYLADHCSWLKTCSVESTVMCNSKYLTRKFITPDEYNLKYYLIRLDVPEDVADAIKAVGFPMILKPDCGSSSEMVKRCDNERDIDEYLRAYKHQAEAGNVSTYYNQNGKLLLGLENKYPHLKELNVLAEEYVENMKTATFEYCVQKGKLIEIAFFDNIYWPSNPQTFLGCSYPSLCHNGTTLKSAKEMTEKMVQRLSRYGFDNCIGNIEYFILQDGSVKLMENNGRMSAQTNAATDDMLYGGDKFRMLFDLQQQVAITIPVYKFVDDDRAPETAITLYIHSMEEGLASDIFNYAYAEQLQRDPSIAPGLTRCEVAEPKYNQITKTSDSGTEFAWCTIIGENFTDCLMKFKPIFHRLLLNSSHKSLWTDEIFSHEPKSS